ncbi:MAG: cobalamin-binding protein [Burkholderiales bacterium]|nr:cobalamin-binding protein [Burkholderiales bacterium]
MKSFLLLCLLSPLACKGSVVARDDAGNRVVLDRPAQRIVSLAPSITELLYAAGAGGRIVGVVDYSDYPKEALRLARVGDAQALDIERIAALHPDLVVAWKSGYSSGQIEKLKSLGLAVFYSEPRRLADIPGDIEQLGVLSGTENVARGAATDFRSRYEDLKKRYAGKSPVPVFFEIWNNPLMTVNDRHIVSDVMHLCGAINVFGSLPVLTPTVSLEAVLHANPEAIVARGTDQLDEWRKWGALSASKSGNFFSIPDDLISRQSPRMLLGAAMLCRQLDDVRNKRRTTEHHP